MQQPHPTSNQDQSISLLSQPPTNTESETGEQSVQTYYPPPSASSQLPPISYVLENPGLYTFEVKRSQQSNTGQQQPGTLSGNYVSECPNPESCVACLQAKVDLQNDTIINLQIENSQLQLDALAAANTLEESPRQGASLPTPTQLQFDEMKYERYQSKKDAATMRIKTTELLFELQEAKKKIVRLSEEVEQYKQQLDVLNRSALVTPTFNAKTHQGTSQRSVTLAEIFPNPETLADSSAQVPSADMPPSTNPRSRRPNLK